ncbi:MAG: tripartite tricarboxylate transporter substrate binding protein [Burkholderiales bacterium]|nr:tripartite tricarboxylate transporter substrate binding protein [Burkholderiales bacterium]
MLRAALLLAVSSVFSMSAALAQTYPSKTIRIMAPFSPGGPVDITARIIAQKLGEALGQTVVVENRAGASGMIGAELVAKSPPDGHTLLANASIHVIVPSLFSKMAYDPIRDFIPVTVASSSPLMLVVTPALPARNVKAFIALAKARPGEMSFGSSGPGSSTHLTAELLKSVTATNMVHIPYKGQGQAITDVITGQIQFMFNSPSAVGEFIKAGRLRTLAITSEKRLPQWPDVPTFVETGYKDMVTGSWYGIWVPAKTPQAIVTRLNTEIVRIINLPDVRQRIIDMGGEPVANSSAEFDAFQKAEMARWAKIVKQAGIEAQ